ncbi:MAG: hypothetical protein M1816_007705 [Peltula sp. TS41687]|nr:MAG: hypothetical protein M1816_007705 [Peltula sp. TS41687]
MVEQTHNTTHPWHTELLVDHDFDLGDIEAEFTTNKRVEAFIDELREGVSMGREKWLIKIAREVDEEERMAYEAEKAKKAQEGKAAAARKKAKEAQEEKTAAARKEAEKAKDAQGKVAAAGKEAEVRKDQREAREDAEVRKAWRKYCRRPPMPTSSLVTLGPHNPPDQAVGGNKQSGSGNFSGGAVEGPGKRAGSPEEGGPSEEKTKVDGASNSAGYNNLRFQYSNFRPLVPRLILV